MTYTYDDDGTYSQRGGGIESMMGDVAMHDDRSLADIFRTDITGGGYTLHRYPENPYRELSTDHASDPHEDSYGTAEMAAYEGVSNSHIRQVNYSLEQYKRRQESPNTREPVYATPYTREQGIIDARNGHSRTFYRGTGGDWSAYAHAYNGERERMLREQHTPTQGRLRAFWGKASQALLSWGWF